MVLKRSLQLPLGLKVRLWETEKISLKMQLVVLLCALYCGDTLCGVGEGEVNSKTFLEFAGVSNFAGESNFGD